MRSIAHFKAIISFFLLLLVAQVTIAQTWRSALYPEDWKPGFTDTAGRFLHDFSYAGYHSGLVALPNISKHIIDITKPPYEADNTGKTDVTNQIQQAIDDASKKGGGVIFFPAGEYMVSVPIDKKFAIRISTNNIVLRGAGSDKSFIKNVTTNIRSKVCISFEPNGGEWIKPLEKAVPLASDVSLPTQQLSVTNAASFKKGDVVVVMTDCTDEFIQEHKSAGQWSSKIRGVRFCRSITGVNSKNNTIEIDVPTRYFLKQRDNARVFKIGQQLEECGIENLSIGNVQNEKSELWIDDNAFNTAGTGPYEVHASHLIRFKYAMNCWVKQVATYRPKENNDDYHTLSNCFLITESRFITVDSCNFQKSQYEGGGGNGYMYTLEGNDCLLKDCYAEDGRHNYDFKEMSSNGNVLFHCKSKKPRYATDFHMWLSMANLIDGFVSDGDYLDASFRPYGPKDLRHMYTTTETVFWNTKGLSPHKFKYLIDSRQWKWGYVIGTSGTTYQVNTKPVQGSTSNGGNKYYEDQTFDTSPEDFVEGEGRGETLMPQSLYLDQLSKRKLNFKKK